MNHIDITQSHENRFDDEVRVTRIITKRDNFGTLSPSVGFGLTPDNDEVFINAKVVRNCKLEVGEEYKMTMCPNEKYISGDSEVKYYAFFCHMPGELDLKTDPQVDLEELIAEEMDDGKQVRLWQQKRAGELLDKGGIWTPNKLAEAVLSKKFPDWSDMDQDDQKVCYSMRGLCEKRHTDGTVARVDIRNQAEQKNASYVFYTTKPERLVKALRKA